MISLTDYTIDVSVIEQAALEIPTIDYKLTINEPTGNFFYDPWKIKEEYKGTPWQEILDSLPCHKGEARLIKQLPASCYHAHADIDDRYHLNITGTHSYLVDINNNNMYPTTRDGQWYTMDTGRIHSAVNFDRTSRVQLVVRHLLNDNKLEKPVNVKLTSLITNLDTARFTFDQTISPWLNAANKNGIINNFQDCQLYVTFDIEEKDLAKLNKIVENNFKVEY
jgi:hypothetical protein